jgi:glycosyltransferase involved in cell wall biosynthesis
MRIAQVAPLYESVPPKFYGGTERIIHYLTEELVRRGHDVTLFASGDSKSSARLESGCPRALRLNKGVSGDFAYHLIMFEKVLRDPGRFDIIHSHVDFLPYGMYRRQPVPVVTTLHGRLDIPELRHVYNEFSDMPLVAISRSQRQPLPEANWQATIHHALPENLYRPAEKPGNYLAFLGRLSPEKRIDRAVEIAKRSGMRLRIAAKIDPRDQDYFREIKPLLRHPLVEFVGEIGENEKNDFLGEARALLFPIDWPEPFGLVVIEAMACGTPVVAFRKGAVREIIEDGVSGFIVDNVEEAVAAVKKAGIMNRTKIRRQFEKRFTVSRMADEYIRVYHDVIAQYASIPGSGERTNGRDHPGQKPVLHPHKLFTGR